MLGLLQDQFRPDGSHVERSTAYQAEAASDLLDVYAASHDPLETEPAANAAEAALGWLAHVSPAYQPRPALNDAPPELGPSTARLLERAAALGLEPFLDLPAKTAPRYVVLGDERTRLLVDFDQPSRPDLPYHAHADSLGIHVTSTASRSSSSAAPGPTSRGSAGPGGARRRRTPRWCRRARTRARSSAPSARAGSPTRR